MKHFLVCVHDATPAYARETRVMIRDLAPVPGRRLSFGVVPNWHGEWPLGGAARVLPAAPDASEELLLHGWGLVVLFAWARTNDYDSIRHTAVDR